MRWSNPVTANRATVALLGEARYLLLDWIKTVRYDHTGSLGPDQAWRCPHCLGLSRRGLPFHKSIDPSIPRESFAQVEDIEHKASCLLARTLQHLDYPVKVAKR